MPDASHDGQLHTTRFSEFVGMPDTTDDGQLQWVVRYNHRHCPYSMVENLFVLHVHLTKLSFSTCTMYLEGACLKQGKWCQTCKLVDIWWGGDAHALLGTSFSSVLTLSSLRNVLMSAGRQHVLYKNSKVSVSAVTVPPPSPPIPLPGLLREDLYREENPEVAEAIRRLPEKEQNLRIFRLKRALDLSLKHSQLPREQWTKPEEVSCRQYRCTILLFTVKCCWLLIVPAMYIW